jgi:hypothetical protein
MFARVALDHGPKRKYRTKSGVYTGTAYALVRSVKKSAYRFERRKHDLVVSLDRRKHDDDFAERMVGGIRASSFIPSRQSATDKPKTDRDDS